MPRFTDAIDIDSICFLQALEPGKDPSTGWHIYQDLAYHGPVRPLDREFISIHRASVLKRILGKLAQLAAAPHYRKFLLQIDAHGLKDGTGIEIASSGERVRWDELFFHLRELNLASANNLLVVLAACHAARSTLYDELDLCAPSPFGMLVAPKSTIASGKLEDSLWGFHRTLAESSSMNEALEHLRGAFAFHSSQRIFYSKMVSLLERMRGKRGRQMLEEATSTQLSLHPGLSPSDARRRAKLLTKPSEALFLSLRNEFLLADHPENQGKPLVTYEDVMTEVERRAKNR